MDKSYARVLTSIMAATNRSLGASCGRQDTGKFSNEIPFMKSRELGLELELELGLH